MVMIQRSLALLSRDLGIAVLLLNDVVDATIGFQTKYPPRHTTVHGAFESASCRLVNGPTFSYGIDMHVLVSQHPHEPDDAGMPTGFANEDTVLEVLVDRMGGRTGRWGAFRIVGTELKMLSC